MKEEAGRIIQFAQENPPVAGCTVSKLVYQEEDRSVLIFSLAKNTSISAESYTAPKLLSVLEGSMEIFTTNGTSVQAAAGESVVTPIEVPVGMQTEKGCVYIEIAFGKESEKENSMNELIKSGNVFELGVLLPYQKDRIVNMDLVSNDKMKFVLMSFDEGTGLSEHAAPGEALVFALDGAAVIGYEGKDYEIHAGETFKFDKFGRHSVTAKGPFKMALLLVLE